MISGIMTDPNGMGTSLGAEHGQHQQGGNSGPLAQQPLQVGLLDLARKSCLGGIFFWGLSDVIPFCDHHAL